MANGLSAYQANAWLDDLTGSTLYVGLHDDDPGITGANEVSGNGYARQSMAFAAASGGAAVNTSAETWTASGGDWGAIGYASVWDADTSGNCLWTCALPASKTITDGESLTVAVGDCKLTLT